tara:strand:+ start:828 stop:1409 length:582 start_codon:yes stop_codon:yes gene_type:complete
MRKHSRIQLFPTLIYDVDCSELIDDVLKEFSKVKWKNNWVNVNDTVFTLDNNKTLVKKIENVVNETLSEIEYTVPLKMSTSWFTRISPGDMGRNHYHTNSFYSGIFYFQDCNSNLVVSKQNPQIHVPFKTKNFGLISSGDVALKADKGHMILIPGDIRHYIEQNLKGENRNSLAMNFMPIGFCHESDSSYNYK